MLEPSGPYVEPEWLRKLDNPETPKKGPAKRDIPKTYKEAKTLLNGKSYKQVCHNTRLFTDYDDIGMVYHNTTIVIYHPDGTLTLRNEGHNTVSTKSRFNLVLKARGLMVYSVKGVWWVSGFNGAGIRFTDGMKVGKA